MSMNKNTSAGKPSRPPPLSLVDYSDEEEVTTPQQSQTSQPMSEDLHTAADHLKSESDAESDPCEPIAEGVPEKANKASTPKNNHGKAIEVSSRESDDEDDFEATSSEEVEEAEIEDLGKDKGKKRKAPSTIPLDIPVRKLARMIFALQAKTQTGGTTSPAEASSAKSKRRPTKAVHAKEETKRKLVHVVSYKKDPRLSEEYLKNQEEERKAAKETQRQAKKKGKSASPSTATPSSGPPPSTPCPKRTDPSGYVPPRQSPRSDGSSRSFISEPLLLQNNR
ncbi:Uncharacterized protein Rs2_10017 [Raphanus sativus]|nr:Uncharacterized protein Rs2_10017 [Raphanus sativus]